MKKLTLLAAIITLAFGACIKQATVNPDQSVSFTLDTVRVIEGSGAQIVPLNYSPEQLNWSSADTSIVGISASGFATAKKPGKSAITVTNKNKTATASCVVVVTAKPTVPPIDTPKTPVVPGIQIPGTATDVAIGGPDSTIYVIGTDEVSPTGGFGIYKVVGGAMVKLPECAGVRIAVAPDGTPWVVNKSHLVYRKTATDLWEVLPGTANDIAIGADGSVYAIGTDDVSPSGGFNIMKWNGYNWDTLPECAGTRIAVAPDGTPWVVNKSNLVYRKTATNLWEVVPGVEANDIAISSVTGSVNVTGKYNATAPSPIYGLSFGPTWYLRPNGAYGENLALTPHGLVVWVDKDHKLFEQKL